ncbi:MAG: hypothetical protein AAGB26_06775 [Planctomycetota bacterium]
MSVSYPTTHWTRVKQIQAASPDERSRLIGRFIEVYLPAIRADIERYMAQDQPHDVDDAVHEFLTDKLYEGFVIDQADSRRGRLTRYIQACVHHFVHSRKSPRVRVVSAEPVGETMYELGESLTSDGLQHDKVDFDWLASALRAAILKTREGLIRKKKHLVWHVLEARLLCDSEEVEPFKVIANRLGLTQKEAANLLITGKRALKRNITSVFVDRLPNTSDVEADIFEACEHVFRERLSFGLKP